MFARLLLAFTLIPLIELVLLFQLSRLTGWGTTIAIVLMTGIVGAGLARQQGRQAWRQVREQLSAGQIPSAEIVDAVLILFAGAFLITPGLLTDLTGFCLLIPWLRQRLRLRLHNWLIAGVRAGRFRGSVHMSGFQFQSGSFTEPPAAADPLPGGDGVRPGVRVVEPDKLLPAHPSPEPTDEQ